MSSAVFLGVRHHSPACARLVARAIATLRPAYVLVEGPADMNGRLDELLLEHRLPVAVFSHYRDKSRVATSCAPLCDYSPEWNAPREGRAAGAQVRFIDLPAWHPAFTERAEGAANRYADAPPDRRRHGPPPHGPAHRHDPARRPPRTTDPGHRDRGGPGLGGRPDPPVDLSGTTPRIGVSVGCATR